ncbi:MAG: ATP-binding protein [Pseudomonadales bacterium]|nr:ATP-binding protein [Pseudomonadales bacterium]NRA16733.1 HAMP domain-containing protein [Oceanospirillaceae bacterium]
MQKGSLSIRVKTILPLAVLGLFAFIQFGYLFSTFSVLKNELEKKINTITHIEQLSFRLNGIEGQLKTLIFSYHVAKDPKKIALIKKKRHQILNTLAEYQGLLTQNRGRAVLQNYQILRLQLATLADQLLLEISVGNSARVLASFEQWLIKEEQISALRADLIGNVINLNQLSLKALQATQKNQVIIIQLSIILNICLIIMAFAWSRKYITNPLDELIVAAKTIARGQYDVCLKLGGKDEIGILTTTFHSMVENVREFNHSLEVMVEQRTTELEQEVEQRKATEAELRHYMIELERSNRDLSQFAYVASHDLQEPLRMVASYTQLLSRRYADQLDQDAHDFIGYAVEGATRMQKLIKDLLQYSKVNSKELKLVQLNFSDIVNRVKANLTFLIEESGGKVNYSNSAVDLKLLSDETLITMLVQNLISNALKFCSDRPPDIRVDVHSKESHWHISVADNGIGIKTEYQHRIFKVFQRLHNRDEFEGNGIGLSICKNIVEKLGGRIWIESIYTEGSVFHFTLAKKLRVRGQNEYAESEADKDLVN